MAAEVEWEAEVKIRRNGRIFRWEKALGGSAGDALYAVTNDLEREFFGDTDAEGDGRG
jgi:uncharacterized membrane protein